ncbi:hypothetical protein VTN49DRAFT_6529 [Thermomyces lanuginosus]|uniref:uncharacterized protein n=1 Tax=Thermomyces lanuginosus TaxID=5541 RepID=UPI0037428957
MVRTAQSHHQDAEGGEHQQLRELPEDDGMSELRQQIHAIRDKKASTAEKARLIHELMTANYYKSSRPVLRSQSPPTSRSLQSPSTPTRSRNRRSSESLGPNSPTRRARIHEVYNLSPEDLEPTFVPNHVGEDGSRPVREESQDNDASLDDSSDEEEENILGCQHYRRNVKLQCYTCKKWYTCRFCHDEAEDHTLERRKTENMLCMVCGLPQPAAQWCKECGTRAASYYCGVCKLWDNDSSKSIYHCYDCGICRVGQGLGKDFVHCKTCGVCIPISIQKTHRCIENSTQCDCPICGDYMFTSPDTVVFMRCGHSIHQKCYLEYSKSSYRCPICSKTIMNMEAQFRNLDRTIESQPMPAEFRDTKALIHCNDCGAKGAVKYHWLGLKCDLCESYNTVQIRLLGSDEDGMEGETSSRARLPQTISGSCQTGNLAESVNQRTTEVLLGPPLSTSVESQPLSHFPRARTITPRVGNYFEMSREHEGDSSWSPSIFSRQGADENSSTGFWASSPLGRYSFFRRGWRIISDTDDDSESEDEFDEEEEEEEDFDDEQDSPDEPELEDDDDDFDPIELFGHI